MKRLFYILLCCLIAILSSIMSTFAQELSREIIDMVGKNLDNFFPLSAVNETFSTKTAAVRGFVNAETATEVSTDGQKNLLLYANPNGINEYAFYDKLNTGNLKNFYYELDVIRNDLYPSDGCGCFIGYINEPISGISTEETVEAVSLVVSDAIYLETKDGDAISGERTTLADLNKDRVRLLIVRLTGETLFFADGKFIGVYHDGKTGPFQLRFGVESFVNGESADCSFDNLIVRKVMP